MSFEKNSSIPIGDTSNHAKTELKIEVPVIVRYTARLLKVTLFAGNFDFVASFVRPLLLVGGVEMARRLVLEVRNGILYDNVDVSAQNVI